ncbi:MAG TPA: ABC transporter substrate-binding protein [Candidatus Binatia bacterium]|jgi:NitT/TauT family transport system substrate-binding protein
MLIEKGVTRKTALACCVFWILLHAGTAVGAEKFRAASGGFGTAIHAVLWAAYHQKIFQKYDLDAEYIAIQSGTTGMQMLLAGEVQALMSGGPQPVHANLQGADITIFAGGLDFFPYKLIVRPDIKSAAQLRGKTLGITSFGSVTELAARMALGKLGVDHRQVTIVQTGGSLNRYAALQGGAIQGTVMFEPLATMAVKNLGMNSLIDMAEGGIVFPTNFFTARRSYIASSRAKIVNFMKATIEGLYALKKDRALGLQLIKRYLRVDDEMAGIGYDYYVAKHGDGILTLPDRRGLELVIEQVARENPKAKGQTPESLGLLDASILEEIKKSGFIEKLKR